MLIVTARFRIQPADADRWPELISDLTKATRAEPGCLWFNWSRSLDDPTEYILIEGYRDQKALDSHLLSAEFEQAQRVLPSHLAETVQIVRATSAQDDWTPFEDLSVPR